MPWMTIKAYHNRTLETLEVIEQLIELAKELREAHFRGDELGLTEDELAFYDALETNDSAIAVWVIKCFVKLLVSSSTRSGTTFPSTGTLSNQHVLICVVLSNEL